MALKFFGRGSGFSDDHTSAYFTTQDNELVIIDCPVSTFQKLKQFDLQDYKEIYVLVTHTHGDHIGGLGLFAQYAYFTLQKTITIVAPCILVANDISTILEIEGNEPSWYSLIAVAGIRTKEWFCDAIPTDHSPQLTGKCFGYHLRIDDINVIYTGDTSTLDPFFNLLKEGYFLYVDVSVNYGMIHLKLEDVLDDFSKLVDYGVKIYLMHVDDVEEAEKLIADYSNVNIVTVEK